MKIFQPFTQAGAGITRQFGGTGLGLALTYNLCEAMQGRLTISSEPGFGSQFCADLPLPCHTRAVVPGCLAGQRDRDHRRQQRSGRTVEQPVAWLGA